MTPETRTYTLTEAKLTAARAALANEGLHLEGDDGEIDAHGFKAKYDVTHAAPPTDNESLVTVAITFTAKPFFIEMSYVWAKVDGAVQSVK